MTQSDQGLAYDVDCLLPGHPGKDLHRPLYWLCYEILEGSNCCSIIFNNDLRSTIDIDFHETFSASFLIKALAILF